MLAAKDLAGGLRCIDFLRTIDDLELVHLNIIATFNLWWLLLLVNYGRSNNIFAEILLLTLLLHLL